MYLNVIQLAESFGVEERIVDGWVRNEGLPCIDDRGRRLFDRAQVVAWAAEQGLVARAGFLAPVRSSAAAGRLGRLLRIGGIWRDVPAAGVLEVLERAVTALPATTPEVRRLLVQRLRAMNGVTWAPIGGGVALPHLRAHVALGRDAGVLALVMLRDALPLAEPPSDGVPVNRLWFFMAPSPRAHLELLAQLSAALAQGELRARVLEAAPDTEILSSLAAADESWQRRPSRKDLP
jgi:PTS system nitrogen regulatory IIA component